MAVLITLLLVLLLIPAALLFVVFFSGLLLYARTHVPFVPSPFADVAEVVRRGYITDADVVYDLGSGSGSVLFAVETLTKARVRGFELSGWPLWLAYARRSLKRSHAQLTRGNFFDYPLHEATVIYTYLLPPVMESLAPKLTTECRSGTRVISRDFPLNSELITASWTTPSGHTMFVHTIHSPHERLYS